MRTKRARIEKRSTLARTSQPFSDGLEWIHLSLNLRTFQLPLNLSLLRVRLRRCMRMHVDARDSSSTACISGCMHAAGEIFRINYHSRPRWWSTRSLFDLHLFFIVAYPLCPKYSSEMCFFPNSPASSRTRTDRRLISGADISFFL